MAVLFIGRVAIFAAHRDRLLLQDKLVAAVCHGPGALTEAELDGEPLVKDKKVQLGPCCCRSLRPLTGAFAHGCHAALHVIRWEYCSMYL